MAAATRQRLHSATAPRLLHEEGRGGKIAVLRTPSSHTERDKETKIKRGTFDRKTRQRKTTPHRLSSFFLGECHRPQRRTYTQSSDQCEQSLAFFPLSEGRGVWSQDSGFWRRRGYTIRGTPLWPSPQVMGGVADDVQCEGGRQRLLQSKHVEREREREK